MTMMKPKHLSEIQALIASPEFQQWWAEAQKCRGQCETVKRRFDELVSEATLTELKAELSQRNAIDTLYQADACEDAAAELKLEADELENRSFRAVSDFEEERFRASEVWYRMGASEKRLEEMREATQKISGKKAGGELQAAEREHRTLAEDYQREMEKKNRLWGEVEGIWARSAEVNLLVAEQHLRGKKIRREAEHLFVVAEEAKKRASQLRSEADAASAESDAAQTRLQAQLQRASELFGCAVGVDFLYFRHKDNQKMAFCVSLIDDHQNYNLEISPLTVYSVERQKGVSLLEPARETGPTAEEGDKRFDDYFFNGRKGEIRSTGP
jgi:hypothetical protein